MKQMLIYERPLPLDCTDHWSPRIRPPTDSFAFAARVTSVPLVVGEFLLAARDYPIVFADNAAGTCMPAALLGLLEDNLFIEPSGQWIEGVHVPVFLRRYPFVVADAAASDDEFSVRTDETVATVGDDTVRLFEGGKDAGALKQMLRFLADYQSQVRQTRGFVRRLLKHDLLVPTKISVPRRGQPTQTLRGIRVIDAARLQSLNGNVLAHLSATGVLGLAYAHLISLGNTERLRARVEARERPRSRIL